MYTGHIGVALGAHGLNKTIPLWILIVASQLPDWADATLCSVGVRPAVPGMFSHSIPAALVLASAAAILYYGRDRSVAACGLVAAVVLSHVAGDYITGIKPTWTDGPMIGLQWYRKPVLDFIFESVVVIGGWVVYRGAFNADQRASKAMLTIPAVLIVIQLGTDILMALAPPLEKC